MFKLLWSHEPNLTSDSKFLFFYSRTHCSLQLATALTVVHFKPSWDKLYIPN